MGDENLDLLGLKDFSFEPDWGSRSRNKYEDDRGEDERPQPREDRGQWKNSRKKHLGGRREGENNSRRERDGKGFGSGSGPRFNKTFRREDRDGQNFRKNRRFSGKFDGKNGKRPEFVPIVEAHFYPEDSYFTTAIAAFRLTCKTYELFNVARLFLEKPERFVVVVKKTAAQEDKNLYMSTDDNFVFADEQSAIGHVLANHCDKYFDVAEEDVEAPKGTFLCIHKCGFTGKLLCPPNYHRYQEILMEHHDENLPRMSFQRFKENIESISDKEAIEEWKASASKVKTYVPKIEGTSEKFTRFADARKFFTEHFKDRAIKVSDSFRIAGTTFDSMPHGILGKSIFSLLIREKKFPLELANNLRSKLRHEKFTIYKAGSASKIAYTCAVKRKFRSPDDRFEEDIQKIIDCIDANQNDRPMDIYRKLYPEVAVPDDPFSEKDENLSAFIKNLNWLLHEGYVAEFEDGRLAATAILPKKQAAANDPDAQGESAEELAAEFSLEQGENIGIASNPVSSEISMEEPSPEVKQAAMDEGTNESLPEKSES